MDEEVNYDRNYEDTADTTPDPVGPGEERYAEEEPRYVEEVYEEEEYYNVENNTDRWYNGT